jgi:hypothetical protein
MSRRTLALLLCLTLLLLNLAGCARRTSSIPPTTPTQPPAATQPGGPDIPSQPAGSPSSGIQKAVDRQQLWREAESLGLFALGRDPAKPVNSPGAYVPSSVQASIPAYKVAADLSNLTNRNQFGDFTADQQRLLAANGFYASPTDYMQPFFLYENNTYLDIPSFVTTDSVLHTYHLFYDWAMRGVEFLQLYPDLGDMTLRMLENSKAAYGRATTPNRKEAALGAVVYFGVPARLLDLQVDLPKEAAPLVEQELAKIAAHQERAQLSFLPYGLDYTQFVPRGHYTRNERFQQYFRAMSWYGLLPFPLVNELGKSGPTEIKATRLALVIAGELDAESERLWRNVYDVTALFVGTADDATPLQYKELAGPQTIADLEDDSAVLAFIQKALAELPEPGIPQVLAGIPTGKQMRFMGQRFVLDSAVLQQLVDYQRRPFPTGLDIAAAWGSKQAQDLVLNVRQEGKAWPEYPGRLNAQIQRVAAVPQSEWQSNLYRGWLWTFQPLLAMKGDGYPAFMRTPAWQDKAINTVLGSWTQLRHDTLLYVKATAAECGGDGEIPPPPPGYVEPEPDFFGRLEWLLRNTLAELTHRGLLDGNTAEQYAQFANLLQSLKTIAEKELTGQALTKEEKDRIRYYGGQLERLSIRSLGGYKGWYEITSDVDREMALVADVHTHGDAVLEEAVGRPAAIVVAFPAEGRIWLGRGAIYTYYEFVHPAADRMTDEAWVKQVQANQEPPAPDWTRSFMTPDKTRVTEPQQRVMVPCGGNGSGGTSGG